MSDPEQPGQRWPRPSRQAGLAAAALLAAGIAAGVLADASLRDSPAAAGGTVRLATAPVVRTDLTNTTQLTGSLGYAGSYTITNELAGTAYTALPGAGRVVRRGQRLYEVDGGPVFLFYGARPEWRALSAGVADGPDVAELDANLIALGYASPADLTVSDVFTWATAAAVERWQAATGQPVTGAVALGQIAYAPGPIRVTTDAVSLGAAVQPGATVLTATSATPVVLAALPVAQEYLVRRGDPVTVTLPDGTTTTSGVVSWISAEATASSGGASGQQSPGASSGSGGTQATVQVTVRLDHPRAAGSLDQAPVTVNIVSARAGHVLAVPLNALVALAGGGYAVELVQGTATRLVAVQTGLFTGTLVEVSGAGLRPGVLVQVPAQ
jgi:Putative peptidoglycan binding domain/HlyD family secretion protein